MFDKHVTCLQEIVRIKKETETFAIFGINMHIHYSDWFFSIKSYAYFLCGFFPLNLSIIKWASLI